MLKNDWNAGRCQSPSCDFGQFGSRGGTGSGQRGAAPLLPFPARCTRPLDQQMLPAWVKGLCGIVKHSLGLGLVECSKIGKGELSWQGGPCAPRPPTGHPEGHLHCTPGPSLQLDPWVWLCLNDLRSSALSFPETASSVCCSGGLVLFLFFWSAYVLFK